MSKQKAQNKRLLMEQALSASTRGQSQDPWSGDKVFVDTSGWASVYCDQDKYHQEFAECMQDMTEEGCHFVTSNYVLAELVPLLSSRYRLSRKGVIKILNQIKTSPSLEIIHIDQALDARAWEHLENRSDKDWSLVDITSFLIMEDLEMIYALTDDYHFAQAHFRPVPFGIAKP